MSSRVIERARASDEVPRAAHRDRDRVPTPGGKSRVLVATPPRDISYPLDRVAGVAAIGARSGEPG